MSSYRWDAWHFLGSHIGGEITREESVPNVRIVDHSSTGPVWTYAFEPDQTGTTLSLACEISSKVPLADQVADEMAWKGDRDLDTSLSNVKQAVEG
jgi:hypothetical protein